ncbi:MAG: hypothetical protein FRX48_00222 [Lasallia pustulata]|nr:MAG: hypothetical protein FRX48_00222 [Lasallia pustulata]
MVDQASTVHPSHSSGHSGHSGGCGGADIWYNAYSHSSSNNTIGPAALAYPAEYYPMDGSLQGMDPGLEQALGMMFGDGDLSAMFLDDGYMGGLQTPGGVYEHMG